MNPIAAWLVSRIAATSSLSSIGARVFPDAAPAKTANPCLIYQSIGGEFEGVLDAGAVKEGMAVYQIRIYAARRLDANALRESFRAAFQNVLPQSASEGFRITGTAYTPAGETRETETEEHGALAVLEIHFQK